MIRFSNLGFVTLAGSLLIVLLQAVVSLTNKDLVWKKVAFADLLEPEYLAWTHEITLFHFDRASDYVIHMPLSMLLLALTVLFFIIGGFFDK